MKKIRCFVLRHKIDKTYCPYTKIMYNVCIKCQSKQGTVLRFQ